MVLLHGGPISLTGKRPHWLGRRVRALVALDALGMIAATLLSQLLAFGTGYASLHVRGVEIPYLATAMVTVPAWVTVLATSGCYRLGPIGSPTAELRQVISAGAHFLAVMAVAYYVAHLEQLGRSFMIAIVPLATTLALVGRAGAAAVLRLERTRGRALRRALVIGPRRSTERLVGHLAHHPAGGIAPIAALVPEDLEVIQANGSTVPVAGRPEDVLRLLSSTDADLLVITGGLAPGELRELTWRLEGTGIDVVLAPSVLELTGPLLDVRAVAGLPLLYVDHRYDESEAIRDSR